MRPFHLLILVVAQWLTSCSSDPTLSVSSSLPSRALRGKTVAIGGLTAAGSNVYPGQTEESSILMDAEQALQQRLKCSRVLSMAAVQQSIGAPPAKFSSGIPIILGSKLSPTFIRQARTQGIDHLLWIDLHDNSVDHSTNQRSYTRSVSSTCSCGKVNGKSCRTGSCSSFCNSSCRSSSTTRETVLSATATRRIGASYSLLDTATRHVVWQAQSMLERSKVNTALSASQTSLPSLPNMPLPPTETEIMHRMTKAALRKLPD